MGHVTTLSTTFAIFFIVQATAATINFSEHLDGDNKTDCGLTPALGLSGKRYAKIIGGLEAVPGQFPFLVSLKYSGIRHFCGGSLISSRWVLTAAHCVSGPVSNFLSAVVGEFYIKQEDPNEKDHKILKILAHEDFRFATLDNDIALIRLQEPVTWSDTVQPVCVVKDDEEDFEPRTSKTVAGWGRLEEGGSLPDKPLLVELKQVDADRCRVHLLHKLTVGDGQICAGTLRGGKDACQGDSGGPLFAVATNGRITQQAIVSSGIGCGRRAKPGVYTKITAHLPWIAKTIKQYEASVFDD